MDAYMYQAALYCADCGKKIRAQLTAEGKAPSDVDDENTYDSDDFPKGPFGDGGGESDCPEHCDACHCFLENPLTGDGTNYVEVTIIEDIAMGKMDRPSITEWWPFYRDDLFQDNNPREVIDTIIAAK